MSKSKKLSQDLVQSELMAARRYQRSLVEGNITDGFHISDGRPLTHYFDGITSTEKRWISCITVEGKYQHHVIEGSIMDGSRVEEMRPIVILPGLVICKFRRIDNMWTYSTISTFFAGYIWHDGRIRTFNLRADGFHMPEGMTVEQLYKRFDLRTIGCSKRFRKLSIEFYPHVLEGEAPHDLEGETE